MRLQLSLSSAEGVWALVPEQGTVNVFTTTERISGISADGLGIIPHQEKHDAYTPDMNKLRAFKVIGYDWLPERLSDNRYNGVVIFTNTRSQYPNQVVEELGKTFKVNHIKLTAADIAALNAKETPAPAPAPVVKTETPEHVYGRARYLYKHNHQHFTQWEADFVTSIGLRLKGGRALTDGQQKQLDRLFDKYKVPFDATASRAYPDDDLSTLRGTVPNGNYANFDPADNMHMDGGWHPNGDASNTKVKKTISGYKRDQKKKRRTIEKKKKADKLRVEQEEKKKKGGNNPEQVDKALAADFGSYFGLNDPVWVLVNGKQLEAEIYGVTFMAGKVLYNALAFTGNMNLELAGRWGQLNNIGWDDLGREYMRINNIDSTFVEARVDLTKKD